MFPSGHRDSEENIEASGLSYTFLRPNGFMQNLVNYDAGTIRSQTAFYGCQGKGAVSMVDIRDKFDNSFNTAAQFTMGSYLSKTIAGSTFRRGEGSVGRLRSS